MTEARYVLGHDIGTSGVKAVLCDVTGRTVGTATEEYGVQHPRPGWAEQDVDELAGAVSRATRRLMSDCDMAPDQIEAIGLSGQMFCVAAVDRRGVPVSPLLSWLDTRAKPQAAAIADRFPDDQFDRFGSIITAKDIVPKIMWLRDVGPDRARDAAAYLDCKDAVAARLSGQIATDHAGASAYLLYDLCGHDWKREAVTDVGIPLDALPVVHDATHKLGGLTREAASAMGVLEGTPLVVGTGDVPAGQVGAGAGRPGEAHLSLGTASYLGISLDAPLRDPGHRLGLLGHLDPDRYLLWAEMETGAGALAWWRRASGLGGADDVDNLVGSMESVVDDVPLFAPWLTGERVPYWDDDARGAFIGLSFRHSRAELTRAVIEGICFQLRLVLEYATAFGVKADQVRVVGGAGLGRVLPAVLADVLDRELLVVDDPQSAAARGAAFCALSASYGISVDDLSDGVQVARVIDPRFGSAPYSARLERFRRLHDALAQVAT